MTRGWRKVRAGSFHSAASEGGAGFRGHPSPFSRAHIPSLRWGLRGLLSSASLSHLSFRTHQRSGMVTRHTLGAWPLGTPPPPPPPRALPGPGCCRGGGGGGCTPGLPGKAPYRARACGCPGLGDPRVASVRHRDDARGAAPAHTLAAGRSSALTCLTLQGRGKIAVRAAPGSPPRPGGPHEAGHGLMREPGWSLTA